MVQNIVEAECDIEREASRVVVVIPVMEWDDGVRWVWDTHCEGDL